jgi:hypothetical protein
MDKFKGISMCCVFLLFLGVCVGVTSTPARAAGAGDSEVLTGDLWVKMTNDSKVAFIWGAGQVVDIEQELMEKYPELKRDSFVTKVVEGMSDIPINDIIATIDAYYTDNPGSLHMPVMAVIWDTMIKPNIRTGIAGQPLN